MGVPYAPWGMTVPARAFAALAITLGTVVPLAVLIIRNRQEQTRLLMQQRDLLVAMHEELRAAPPADRPQVPQPREHATSE